MKTKPSIALILGTAVLFSIALCLLFSGCKKEPEPEPTKLIDVTYCWEFERATDFTIEGSNYGANFKESVVNTKGLTRACKVEDKPERTSSGSRTNVWVGACVTKTADQNNIKMKVSAIIGTDTVKQCKLGSCCTAN